MQRCLELAKRGAGYVAPNPIVGAVLVYEDQIIGEGWHQRYGEAHAEVNCINAVKEEDKQFISLSTLYVSLEPCAHFGKTPPCTDLIMQHKIPKVVIGCRDSFKEVDGKGIEKLEAAGVEVLVGELETEAKELNKRFFTFHTQHRPYIILKWAQTADGKMAPPPPEEKASPSPSAGGVLGPDNSKTTIVKTDSKNPPAEGREASRLLISNEYSNRLVHKWRSEEAAILIGTNTALQDDPELTTRLWPGPSPVRLVIDKDLKLPGSLKLFNNKSPTIIFNSIKHSDSLSDLPPPLSEGVGGRPFYYQVTLDVNLVHQIVNVLYQLKIQSLIVEGGAQLLQSFIDEALWDEVRVIMNSELNLRETQNGINAPVLRNAEKVNEEKMLSDIISIYKPKGP